VHTHTHIIRYTITIFAIFAIFTLDYLWCYRASVFQCFSVYYMNLSFTLVGLFTMLTTLILFPLFYSLYSMVWYGMVWYVPDVESA